MRLLTTQNTEQLLLDLHKHLVIYSNRNDFYNFYPLEAEKLMNDFQILTDGKYKKNDLVIIAKKLNKLIKANELSYQAYKLINSI